MSTSGLPPVPCEFTDSPFSARVQQAVQEKFRQAGENLDNLNAWLDRVEKEIASQENISEDMERLKSQISAVKVYFNNLC